MFGWKIDFLLIMERKIVRSVNTLLKAQGFKRKELAWNRVGSVFTQVIDLQIAKHGSESFTINLGIFHPKIHMLCWEKPAPDFIREVDCLIRIRIGYLIGDKDCWWDILQNDDSDGIVDKILGVIDNTVVPFFESIKSLADVHRFVVENPQSRIEYWLTDLQLAILKIEIGLKNDAIPLLRVLSKDKGLHDKIVKIAQLNHLQF